MADLGAMVVTGLGKLINGCIKWNIKLIISYQIKCSIYIDIFLGDEIIKQCV